MPLSLFQNPILGIGMGNWQLESIKADRENIQSYIIPYHVHNDFLELAAEIGIYWSYRILFDNFNSFLISSL